MSLMLKPIDRWRQLSPVDLRSIITTLPLLLAATGCSSIEASPGGTAHIQVDYRDTPHEAVAQCSDLAKLDHDGVITRPRLVPATDRAPEHCELIAQIEPETAVYVGLPKRWNGRIWMMGNGGFAGGAVGPTSDGTDDHTVEYRLAAAASGMRQGFVTVYTNGGHYRGTPFDGSFALGRLDLLEDLAHRSVHESIKLAKAAAQSYYAMRPTYSYFEGCSTGGRQGLMTASRYPDDFDGIVANAPVLRWSDLMVKARWNQIALDTAPSLTQAKLSSAFQVVLRKCDPIDGVNDGLIADPRQCAFDPDTDLPSCGEQPHATCFTDPEKQALADIRRGPPLRGERRLPQYWDTLAPETTERWLVNDDGSASALSIMAQSFFKFAAFLPEQDPDYDWRHFDFTRDAARMQAFDDLMNPPLDFSAFRERGGKILGIWGWADASVNPAMGIDFQRALAQRIGNDAAQNFYRQYFIPGVGNCSGGYGPDEIDVVTPLIDWVEAGQLPERLPARKTRAGNIVYNRAYCPFPQATLYRGGDPENPENWQCSEN